MQGIATKNTHNTIRPMFSANQTKAPSMHVRGTDDKDTTIAAIFKHSKSSDYDESKLNPLQKNIMATQDRILELEDNENINPDDKKEQIRNLNETLSELKMQLNEQESLKSEEANTSDTTPEKDTQTPTNAKTPNKQNKTTSNEQTPPENQVSPQDALNKTTSALLSTDAALDKVQTLHTTGEKMNSLANVKARDLYYAMHYPVANPEESPLVLRDPEIIKKRQGEIHELRNIAQNIEGEIGEIVHDDILTDQPENSTSQYQTTELTKQQKDVKDKEADTKSNLQKQTNTTITSS
ncbi:MAG: hypothetical protein K0Q53_410 [Massilibacillus sp.]|jgi:hypothetical protein|nr:hypothetical protein [Massilibacillus sp.]